MLSWNILRDLANAPNLCSRSNVVEISLDIVPACCANALRGGLAEPFAAAFSCGVSSDCRDEPADCFCWRLACATMLENSEVRFCIPIVNVGCAVGAVREGGERLGARRRFRDHAAVQLQRPGSV